jgi:DNA-directed RNA polymerase subunit RPC12/RpoP
MCRIDYHHFGNRFKQTYACFGCRKAFEAGDEFVAVKVPVAGGFRLGRAPRKVACPDCGGVMARMGRL